MADAHSAAQRGSDEHQDEQLKRSINVNDANAQAGPRDLLG